MKVFQLSSMHMSNTVLGSEKSRRPGSRPYKPIGCFRDGGRNPRPLSTLLADLRNKIDWYNLNKTIDECSRLADKKGFNVFGVQFYGECWSGKGAEFSYGKDGKANKCVAGVGQERANYVYRFLKKGIYLRCEEEEWHFYTRCQWHDCMQDDLINA